MKFLRLQRVMQKAREGEPITIEFIGGSITQGAGASEESKRYADHVKRWWSESFPDSEITYVKAGICGTPSKFGVFRADPTCYAINPTSSSLNSPSTTWDSTRRQWTIWKD